MILIIATDYNFQIYRSCWWSQERQTEKWSPKWITGVGLF